MDFQALIQKMIRAAKLDATLYEEVEKDQNATVEAAVIVIAASVLGGIGGLLTGGISGFLMGIIGALVGWTLWAFVTYLVGTNLFGGKADVGEMLRVLGFAYTPMCLGIIPFLGTLVGAIWTVVCFVVAVRQGLDFEGNGKAIATILLGLVAVVMFQLILGFFFGAMKLFGS